MEVIINEDQALQAVLGKYEYFKSLLRTYRIHTPVLMFW